MALDCQDSGRETVLIAADSSRAAAREQVHGYGEAAGLQVIDAFDAEAIAAALGKARPGACLFADVAAGPLPAIALHGSSHHAYLAIPGHWQRGALDITLEAFDLSRFSRAVLTFTDISTDLSPALFRSRSKPGLGIVAPILGEGHRQWSRGGGPMDDTHQGFARCGTGRGPTGLAQARENPFYTRGCCRA